MKTIIAFSDWHRPWNCPRVEHKTLEAIKHTQPSHIICCGDDKDMFSFGRWARCQNVILPAQEIKKAHHDAMLFWQKVHKYAPGAHCHLLKGNHDERPHRKLLAQAPELEVFIDIDKYYEYEGVQVHHRERDELILNNIVFIHGYQTKLGAHCRDLNMNVVCGHSHKGGVAFVRRGNKTLWELNLGHGCQRHAEPFSYTKMKRLSSWTPGFGIIDGYGPRFVPVNK